MKKLIILSTILSLISLPGLAEEPLKRLPPRVRDVFTEETEPPDREPGPCVTTNKGTFCEKYDAYIESDLLEQNCHQIRGRRNSDGRCIVTTDDGTRTVIVGE